MSLKSSTIEPCVYGGWAHNLRLANGEVEAVVTLDVGPRVIRYGFVGGANVLGERPADLGHAGEDGWKMRGGHRLWIAPEEPGRTYVPDNGAVSYGMVDGRLRVTTAADPVFHLEKTIELALAPSGTDLLLIHRVRNVGRTTVELAPWALTVMAAGGTAVVPLARRETLRHTPQTSQDFAPAMTFAVWPYFTFDDPRVRFGRSALRVRQDRAAKGPTKLGLAHRAGWAGYWNAGIFFLKRFGYEEGARYPDGGSNFETYSDPDILELETLGPLVTLEPGAETSHTESWSLMNDLPDPTTDEIVERAFFPRISPNLGARSA